MPTIKITRPSGETVSTLAACGQSLMQVIRAAGLEELQALCGGTLACATCHVHIAPEWLNKVEPKTSDEDDLLYGADNLTEFSRLSCQITISDDLDGLKVRIA